MTSRTSLISILGIIVVCLLLTASRPLICWTVKLTNNGIEMRRVYGSGCTSTEFDGKPAVVELTQQPTETPEPWTPAPTWTPTEAWQPTATWEPVYPIPTMPTMEPYSVLQWEWVQ